MTIAPGTRLGHYEIVGHLGAGGMGEVYRATDATLGRDVALKVLPAELTADPARVERLQREARALAALDHPGIVTVHSVEEAGGIHFLTMQLVDGQPLDRLIPADGMPVQRVVALGAALAEALAAAHERGIVHRDLKPANVMISGDGRLKVLDFGLAKLAESEAEPDATISHELTQQGAVMGTAPYMAPEQVRGKPTDHRADVFAFGCILYEMASGRRAFRRETGAETMTAIMKEDPTPLTEIGAAVPAALDRLVRHCLEKDPARRFQAMRDVGFALETVAQAPAAAGGDGLPAAQPRRAAARLGWAGFGAAAIAAAWAVTSWRSPGHEPPQYTKLTFQRGTIFSARLAPDGHTVVYGANWRGTGLQLFSKRIEAPESRPLGLAADILAISPSGDMALSLDRHTVVSLLNVGRLAQAPLGGGAPREILDGVVDADWSPDGSKLAVTHEIEGEARLEYPLGTVLHRAGGYLSSPRVSPDGSRVAFIKHQVKGDDRGAVAVVDGAGSVTIVSPDLPSVTGLAWGPGGREVWYSAWVPPGGYAIEAVTPGGGTRTVLRSGNRTRLLDLRGDRALIGNETAMAGVSGIMQGDERERDLSYLDGTCATDMAADGTMLLFSEGWIGGGSGYSFYVRRSSGGEPVRLDSGWGSDLSGDGKWALSYPVDPPMRLVITPTGPGQARRVDLPQFEAIGGANWFPGEQRVLVWASRPGEAFRGYVIDLPDGSPRAITPPGVTAPLFSNAPRSLSPDGTYLVATGNAAGLALYPVDGGQPRPVPGASPTDGAIAWTGDGRGLLVRDAADTPSHVYVLDIRTGRRELWRTLMPADPAGVTEILGVVATPDRRYYAYSYLRMLTELFVVDGLTEPGSK